MTYGTNGDGWKSGQYYTAYVSQNPKFYSIDRTYGKKKYTPFWNIVKEKYQAEDCGVDCDYLGPRNLMMSFFVYITLFCVFVSVIIITLCNKDKVGINPSNTPSFLNID